MDRVSAGHRSSSLSSSSLLRTSSSSSSVGFFGRTDPAADIGDLYGWMSEDGRRLNLAMTIVAHAFSDQLQYAFHVDSANAFGDAGIRTGTRVAKDFKEPEILDSV